MEEKFDIGPFRVEVFLREVAISRSGNKLLLNPASLNVGADLILTAMGIETFSLLPKRIHHSPFVITFGTHKELGLETEDLNSSSIPFSFEEGDTLIQALQAAHAKWIDHSKVDNMRDSRVPRSEGPDSPFEVGR